MENERKTMPFGKTFRVGNFSVVKTNRALSKKQIAELRDEVKLPKELLRGIHRGGLPYVKVAAISGVWAVEFTAPSTMFMFLDTRDYDDQEAINGLHNLFTMWLTDTCLMGDSEYLKSKGRLISELIERQSKASTAESEEEALNEVATMMEAKEKMQEAANELLKTEEDG